MPAILPTRPTGSKKPAKSARPTENININEPLFEFLVPPLPAIELQTSIPDAKRLTKARHVLLVFPLPAATGDSRIDDACKLPARLPGRALLEAVLARKNLKVGALRKTPQQVVSGDGALWSYVALFGADADTGSGKDPVIAGVAGGQNRFEQQVLLRKAVMPLLEEKPGALTVIVLGEAAWSEQAAEIAAYVTLVNAVPIQEPSSPDEAAASSDKGKGARKAKKTAAGENPECSSRPLETLSIYGATLSQRAEIEALAAGNLMARRLTALPPNRLTPAVYRRLIERLAREMGWSCETFDIGQLKKLGAGAFLAVAQGSPAQDAAIVHLTYKPSRPAGAKKTALRQVALVGKGICFDTGGLNLKPARYMAGMHEDMSGSAVALAGLFVAGRLQLPLRIDAWLAIAENDLSPSAYKQGAIVKAVNGDRIEVVHTDAEGRMVLADTLALATGRVAAEGVYAQIVRDPGKPDMVIDYATLTGSMTVALGTRYAGVFTSDDSLVVEAVDAGRESGERVCVFPGDADYAEGLETSLADVKQCTLEGEADHILATCFLRRFVGKKPWVHVDLSAASCKGGLGAVSTDTTGFGVAWTLAFLRKKIKNPVVE